VQLCGRRYRSKARRGISLQSTPRNTPTMVWLQVFSFGHREALKLAATLVLQRKNWTSSDRIKPLKWCPGRTSDSRLQPIVFKGQSVKQADHIPPEIPHPLPEYRHRASVRGCRPRLVETPRGFADNALHLLKRSATFFLPHRPAWLRHSLVHASLSEMRNPARDQSGRCTYQRPQPFLPAD
jgi:hypothetical protein